MQDQQELRRFSVHPTHGGPSSIHVVEGVSFEDAALSFVEHWHPEPDEDHEVSLMVTDALTGDRLCFRVDLENNSAVYCD